MVGIELEDERFFSLYEGNFPLITKDEYIAFRSTSIAIRCINTTLVTEDNYETLIEMIYEREYSSAEGKLLIHQIFDPDYYSSTIAANRALAADIADEIDYGKLHIRNLSMEDRETIYTFLAPIFTARGLSLDNQMRKLNCFVESVEEKIAQIANEEHYYKLISELDELTEVGLKYLSERSLTIGLSEKLAAELRAGGNESNYVIANSYPSLSYKNEVIPPRAG